MKPRRLSLKKHPVPANGGRWALFKAPFVSISLAYCSSPPPPLKRFPLGQRFDLSFGGELLLSVEASFHSPAAQASSSSSSLKLLARADI